ncbi:hypothetical protein AKL14_01665 [Streptococcus parauberis]|nr:hypothetical protein AKL14_01665 [Streptococcus parauberis]
MTALLTIDSIHKVFEAGTVNENHVLRGLSLEVDKVTSFLLLGAMELVSQH